MANNITDLSLHFVSTFTSSRFVIRFPSMKAYPSCRGRLFFISRVPGSIAQNVPGKKLLSFEEHRFSSRLYNKHAPMAVNNIFTNARNWFFQKFGPLFIMRK